MTYFSSFWYKHYKELRNCCMTEPLITHPFVNERDKKAPPDLDGKLIRDLIDVGWMSEKGLKWFGWDVNGWLAWTDANGMIYRIRDLKRNENGKRFEKEVKNIVRGDEPRDDIHANANQLYQHEFNLCVDCQLCPDRSGVTDSDDDTDTSTDGGGGEKKEEQINVTAPPWQTFAGGGAPDYGGINTGYNPDVPGGNYGGNGDGYSDYTPPTADPGETVKTDGVTDTTKAAGGSNTPAKEGGKTTTSIDVTQSPAAPPPKHGSDIGKDIKIQEVAKIDKLRVKPNIPPENKDIKFPTPSKPIKDADDWFKQPDQNPANKPPLQQKNKKKFKPGLVNNSDKIVYVKPEDNITKSGKEIADYEKYKRDIEESIINDRKEKGQPPLSSKKLTEEAKNIADNSIMYWDEQSVPVYPNSIFNFSIDGITSKCKGSVLKLSSLNSRGAIVTKNGEIILPHLNIFAGERKSPPDKTWNNIFNDSK